MANSRKKVSDLSMHAESKILNDMLENGYQLRGDILYIKGIEQHHDVFNGMQTVQQTLLIKHFKIYKFDIIETVKELPLKCFNGVFYDTNDDVKLLIDVMKLIKKINKSLDYNQINTAVKAAKQYLAISEIPEISISKYRKRAEKSREDRRKKYGKGGIKPKGIDFRFPKIAYQLMKAWLFSETDTYSYIFTIMSEGGKGKSTFVNFLNYFFKNETYSAIAKNINRFSLASFAGSRLIIFNECTAHYMENSDIFKTISGSDTIQVENKGEQAFNTQMDARMLLLGNELPNYDVTDSGLQRRFINLTWENNFIPSEYNWVSHEWTGEEIYYQLLEITKVEELDYKTLQIETIKNALKSKSAFEYEDYDIFEDREKNAYGREKFDLYWKSVLKFFSYEEWSEAVFIKKSERRRNKWEKKEDDFYDRRHK